MSDFPKNSKADTSSEVNDAVAKDAPRKPRCQTKKAEGSKTKFDSSTRAFMASNSSMDKKNKRRFQEKPRLSLWLWFRCWWISLWLVQLPQLLCLFSRGIWRRFMQFKIFVHKEVSLCISPFFKNKNGFFFSFFLLYYLSLVSISFDAPRRVCLKLFFNPFQPIISCEQE